MEVKTIVIPIAGLGTRLLPVSSLVAKEFLPLGKKPAIQHIAEEAAAAGIAKIVFVASRRKLQVSRLFEHDENLMSRLVGDKSYLSKLFWTNSAFADVEIVVCIQEEQLGLGHAILCSEKFTDGNSFAVALGDCLIGLPGQQNCLCSLLKAHKQHNADIAILFESVSKEKVSRYGVGKIGQVFDDPNAETFELDGIVEKPKVENAPSRFAVCGRYVFANQIFGCLKDTKPGKNGEIQLTDAIESMIQNGGKAIGMKLPDDQKRYDVGDIRTYVQSFVEFANADVELKLYVQKAVSEHDRNSES